MEDYEVSEVARILNEWNPLGDDAERVDDLDGYKTESADILFEGLRGFVWVKNSNELMHCPIIVVDSPML